MQFLYEAKQMKKQALLTHQAFAEAILYMYILQKPNKSFVVFKVYPINST